MLSGNDWDDDLNWTVDSALETTGDDWAKLTAVLRSGAAAKIAIQSWSGNDQWSNQGLIRSIDH